MKRGGLYRSIWLWIGWSAHAGVSDLLNGSWGWAASWLAWTLLLAAVALREGDL